MEPDEVTETPEAPEAAENVEAPETPAPESEASPQVEPEAEDTFADRFDPQSLSPELREQYDLMRGDYTRKTQEVAPLRKLAEELGLEDPADKDALFRALAEHLEYDLDEAEEDIDEEIAPDGVIEDIPGESVEDRLARIEAIEAARVEEAQQAVVEENRLTSLDEGLQAIEEALDRDVTDGEIALIGALGVVDGEGYVDLPDASVLRDVREALGRDLDADTAQAVLALAPENDVVAGAKKLAEMFAAQQVAWQQSKESPSVLPEAGSGAPAPDLETSEGRMDRIAEVIAAHQE